MAEPALSEELLRLGEWIAEFYAAPIGETLKTMLPLSAEVREAKRIRLTDRGAEAAAQFMRSTDADDPFVLILRAKLKSIRSHIEPGKALLSDSNSIEILFVP